jgi:hypothetical protein
MDINLGLYAPWREGIRRAHDLGDSRLLIQLLRSKIEMPDVMRPLLAAQSR